MGAFDSVLQSFATAAPVKKAASAVSTVAQAAQSVTGAAQNIQETLAQTEADLKASLDETKTAAVEYGAASLAAAYIGAFAAVGIFWVQWRIYHEDKARRAAPRYEASNPRWSSIKYWRTKGKRRKYRRN